MVLLSISVLDADFSKADEWLKILNSKKIDYIHWDIMDGKYVDRKTFDSDFVREFSKKTRIPFDVHLMVNEPENFVSKYIDFSKIITFHVECSKDPLKIIDFLQDNGVKAGISINKDVSVESVLPYLSAVDLVLVMSVQAGYGGQKFDENALNKIRFLRDVREFEKLNFLIEVDGGINNILIKKCNYAGADILVVGSYVFKQKDISYTIDSLLE